MMDVLRTGVRRNVSAPATHYSGEVTRRAGRVSRGNYGDGVVNWKKALVVALVVLLMLIGVPILMPGMGGATCHDCGPAIGAGQACSLLAVLAGFALTVLLSAFRFRTRRDLLWDLLRSLELDRPPQLA